MVDEWTAFTSEITKVRQCKLAVYLDSLPEHARSMVLDALKDSKVSSRSLVKALNSRGYGGDKTVVQEHRNGECSCVRGSR